MKTRNCLFTDCYLIQMKLNIFDLREIMVIWMKIKSCSNRPQNQIEIVFILFYFFSKLKRAKPILRDG